jgi:hypothetical protein
VCDQIEALKKQIATLQLHNQLDKHSAPTLHGNQPKR